METSAALPTDFHFNLPEVYEPIEFLHVIVPTKQPTNHNETNVPRLDIPGQ